MEPGDFTPEDLAALFDETPTQTEKQRALAAALSRQRAFGQLGMMSPATRDVGLPLIQGADKAAAIDAAAGAKADAVKRFLLEKTLAAQRQKETDARAERFHQDTVVAGTERDKRANQTLQVALSQLGLSRRAADRADEAQAEAKKARVEAGVTSLSKELGDNPSLIAQKLGRLQKTLADTPRGELEGVGVVAGRVPDVVTSNKGLSTRSDAKALANLLLAIQSGTGVSNQERENFYRIYGVNDGASEAAFRQGMAKLAEDLPRAIASRQAGHSPEVVETYKARGGVTAEAIGQSATVIVTNGTETVRIPVADLPAAQADGFKVRQ